MRKRNAASSAPHAATLSASSVLKPLVVIAAVPRRIPLVTNGDCGSFGIVFYYM